ncbi:MAG: hypothetical protein J5881_03370 [Clostridia bacterium]|nr:hypothetical protein [Clostridia bacterium]
MESSQDKNYEYYILNKKELCKKYLNRYLIIKDESVVGAYETFEEALKEAKNIEAGTYIIQKCEKDEEVQIFHTRIRFDG